MRTLAVFLFIWCWAVTGAAAAGAPEERFATYAGEAKARHADVFLYAEKHFLVYRGERLAERVVLYACRDGSAFARKTVNYTDPTAPDFMLDDAGSGLREGLRTEARRIVFFRGSRNEPQKEKALLSISGLVADAGFDEFIHAQWGALMTGNPVPLQFLVPSRLGSVNFTAQRLHSDHVSGMPVEMFRLKLYGLLGLAVSGIDVTYSSADHQLLRYEGVSDLRDASGNNYQVVINYPTQDRGGDEGSAIAAARTAPLAACR